MIRDCSGEVFLFVCCTSSFAAGLQNHAPSFIHPFIIAIEMRGIVTKICTHEKRHKVLDLLQVTVLAAVHALERIQKNSSSFQ